MNAPVRPTYTTWRAGGYAKTATLRSADPSRLQSLAGPTMGTTWSLRFDNLSMRPHDAVRAAVTDALDRVVAQMSTWESTSDISRFNAAEAGTRHALPAAFADVLAGALHWAEASGGAIDPTVGALVALWGFGAQAPTDQRPRPPSSKALAGARSRIGWKRLCFDAVDRHVTQPGGLQLDLSGIAKGFAVDQVTEALLAIGLQDFLVEVGGELRGVGGRPDGQPWRVRLDTPLEPLLPVTLTDLAIATSGDRWHAHAHAGRRWSHTIDPRSGEPTSHVMASVTVLHPLCMHADALATALTVLGPTDGAAFAACHEVAALFVCRDGDAEHRAIATPAWTARVA